MSGESADSFDVLREMIAAEYPDRLSLFDQCMHRFRRLSPDDDLFQFLIATGFLTLILRSVPERVAAVLAGFEVRVCNGSPGLAATGVVDTVPGGGSTAVNPQAFDLASVVRRLETVAAAHEAAAARHRTAGSFLHPLYVIAVMVMVGVLGGLAGYFYARQH